MFPEHVERSFLDPEYSLLAVRRILRTMFGEENVRLIKNGLNSPCSLCGLCSLSGLCGLCGLSSLCERKATLNLNLTLSRITSGISIKETTTVTKREYKVNEKITLTDGALIILNPLPLVVVVVVSASCYCCCCCCCWLLLVLVFVVVVVDC